MGILTIWIVGFIMNTFHVNMTFLGQYFVYIYICSGSANYIVLDSTNDKGKEITRSCVCDFLIIHIELKISHFY